MSLSVAFVCAFLLFGAGSKTARANTNDVFALSCAGAVHVADFISCVKGWEVTHGATGLADTQLTTTDQVLFGPLRVAGKLTGPIKIPPAYGVSAEHKRKIPILAVLEVE